MPASFMPRFLTSPDSTGRVRLLNGLANLWRVVEPLPERSGRQRRLHQAALLARTELERAYQLCPTDHRIPPGSARFS